MTPIYNGWTKPEINNDKYRMDQLLGQLLDAIGPIEYTKWWYENANHQLGYKEIANLVEAKLNSLDDCQCETGSCKCKPIDTGEFD